MAANLLALGCQVRYASQDAQALWMPVYSYFTSDNHISQSDQFLHLLIGLGYLRLCGLSETYVPSSSCPKISRRRPPFESFLILVC
jgi:hypothetical protein